LPATLDETYERTLEDIPGTNWEFARRLLQCVVVVSRPLRVEELADLLAFDFTAGQIPEYHEDWRLEDPVEAVLSTCSTLLTLVNIDDSPVIQFSHFSVKEFLTSARFAEKHNTISDRYHVSMTPAHTLVAQACLGILLYLDQNASRDSLTNFPFAKYAAEHWFEHARFQGVPQDADEGMEQLFDRTKHHLVVWLRICDPTLPSWQRDGSVKVLSPPPLGAPLHYAAFCGLQDVVKDLAVEYPEDVNSRNFDHESTPLYLASREGHVEAARILIEHGADMAARNKDGETPLHRASYGGHVELTRLLLKHGANVTAQSKSGDTPLHRASEQGHLEIAKLLVEHGADTTAQTKDGATPLHQASVWGHLELARLLVKHGADVTAQNLGGMTPLHWVSEGGNVEIAKLLIEHGADAAAQAKYGVTPLHWASERGHLELARLLVKHGADSAAQNNDGQTPLHWASEAGHADFARLLLEDNVDPVTQATSS
jgi:ankyrin repeat protein